MQLSFHPAAFQAVVPQLVVVSFTFNSHVLRLVSGRLATLLTPLLEVELQTSGHRMNIGPEVVEQQWVAKVKGET